MVFIDDDGDEWLEVNPEIENSIWNSQPKLVSKGHGTINIWKSDSMKEFLKARKEK